MHKSKSRNANTPKAQFPNVPEPVRRELFAAMTRGPSESRLELDAAKAGKPKERYFGRWGHVLDVNRDFDISGKERLEDAEVLFASYDNEDYSGHAVVLFERNGVLQEVEGSHCSCHGLEGQFQPGEVTWEALALRLPEIVRSGGFLRSHSKEAITTFCNLVMSHVNPGASKSS